MNMIRNYRMTLFYIRARRVSSYSYTMRNLDDFLRHSSTYMTALFLSRRYVPSAFRSVATKADGKLKRVDMAEVYLHPIF